MASERFLQFVALGNGKLELEDIQRAIDVDDIGFLLQKNASRSIEWLNINGRCIDHIVGGLSTIEGAGHGAFAKRNIPKDTIKY